MSLHLYPALVHGVQFCKESSPPESHSQDERERMIEREGGREKSFHSPLNTLEVALDTVKPLPYFYAWFFLPAKLTLISSHDSSTQPIPLPSLHFIPKFEGWVSFPHIYKTQAGWVAGVMLSGTALSSYKVWIRDYTTQGWCQPGGLPYCQVTQWLNQVGLSNMHQWEVSLLIMQHSTLLTKV